jgi:hypothetical protein
MATTVQNMYGYTGSALDRYVIDPRESKYIGLWDIMTFQALVFTAIVTPYEVSFIAPLDYVDSLFVINRLVDAIFFADLLLQFFLAIPTTTKHASGSTVVVWETRFNRIARRYLKGMFCFDLFSLSVSGIDVVTLVMEGENEELRTLKVLRTVRVLRLVKLVRLLSASRILKHWETRVAINYEALVLFQCILKVMLFSHWSACFWTLQTTFVKSLSTTWLCDSNYCGDPEADVRFEFYASGGGNDDGILCYPPGNIYAAALYWSMMTITSQIRQPEPCDLWMV